MWSNFYCIFNTQVARKDNMVLVVGYCSTMAASSGYFGYISNRRHSSFADSNSWKVVMDSAGTNGVKGKDASCCLFKP